MPETTEEFKSEKLSVTVKEKPNCQVIFEVEVAPSQVVADYREAVKRVGKEVSIPGFRKGRAPAQLIEQRYSSPIDSEWRELVIRNAFFNAMQLTKISPDNSKSIGRPNLKHCNKESGASVIFNFEREPIPGALDLSKLNREKQPVKEVTDALREKELNYLKTVQSEWKEAEEGQVIEAGHRVSIKIEIEGEMPVLAAEYLELLLEPETGIWLHKGLVGKKVGETAEFKETSLPEESQGENLNNRLFFMMINHPCKVTVNKIFTREEKEINDELAQSFGSSSVDELKERIEKVIENQNKEEVETAYGKDLENAILSQCNFEVPQSKLAMQQEIHLRNFIEYLMRLGFKPEYIESKKEMLEKQAYEKAERFLKLFYIYKAMPGEAHRQITHEDLVTELQYQMHFLPYASRLYYDKMSKETVQQQMTYSVFVNNSLQHIKNQLQAKDS